MQSLSVHVQFSVLKSQVQPNDSFNHWGDNLPQISACYHSRQTGMTIAQKTNRLDANGNLPTRFPPRCRNCVQNKCCDPSRKGYQQTGSPEQLRLSSRLIRICSNRSSYMPPPAQIYMQNRSVSITNPQQTSHPGKSLSLQSSRA